MSPAGDGLYAVYRAVWLFGILAAVMALLNAAAG